jgi:hypothetical protein
LSSEGCDITRGATTQTQLFKPVLNFRDQAAVGCFAPQTRCAPGVLYAAMTEIGEFSRSSFGKGIGSLPSRSSPAENAKFPLGLTQCQ